MDQGVIWTCEEVIGQFSISGGNISDHGSGSYFVTAGDPLFATHVAIVTCDPLGCCWGVPVLADQFVYLEAVGCEHLVATATEGRIRNFGELFYLGMDGSSDIVTFGIDLVGLGIVEDAAQFIVSVGPLDRIEDIALIDSQASGDLSIRGTHPVTCDAGDPLSRGGVSI